MGLENGYYVHKCYCVQPNGLELDYDSMSISLSILASVYFVGKNIIRFYFRFLN